MLFRFNRLQTRTTSHNLNNTNIPIIQRERGVRVPRNRKSIEFRESDEKQFNALLDTLGVCGDDFTNKFRGLLDKCYAHFVIGKEYAPATPALPPFQFKEKCKLRVFYKGQFQCYKNPPKGLPICNPDICDVACAHLKENGKLRLAIPTQGGAKASEFSPSTSDSKEAPLPVDIPLATRELFKAHYDHGKHCPFTSCRIFQSTCYNCNINNRPRWDQCRTLTHDILTWPQTPKIQTQRDLT